jgi:hypothetical protein
VQFLSADLIELLSRASPNNIQGDLRLRRLARFELSNVEYRLCSYRQAHQKCVTEASTIPPTYNPSVLRMSLDYLIVLEWFAGPTTATTIWPRSATHSTSWPLSSSASSIRRRRPTWWHSVARHEDAGRAGKHELANMPPARVVADRGRSSLPFCLFTRVPYRVSGGWRANPRTQTTRGAGRSFPGSTSRIDPLYAGSAARFRSTQPADQSSKSALRRAGCRRSSTTFSGSAQRMDSDCDQLALRRPQSTFRAGGRMSEAGIHFR